VDTFLQEWGNQEDFGWEAVIAWNEEQGKCGV
jgi:hypothetical protein